MSVTGDRYVIIDQNKPYNGGHGFDNLTYLSKATADHACRLLGEEYAVVPYRAGGNGPMVAPEMGWSHKSENKVFPSGAQRSKDADGVRYDLISPVGLRRIAQTCKEGADKYDDYNWEKGMPMGDLLNHAIKHIYDFLDGDTAEDHLGHAGWGILAAMHSQERWPHLNKGTEEGRKLRQLAEAEAIRGDAHQFRSCAEAQKASADARLDPRIEYFARTVK